MRNVSLILIAAVICGSSVGFTATNLLTNPGFETGDFTGWTHTSGAIAQNGSYFMNPPSHGGTYMLGCASNALTDPAQISQQVNVTAGLTYEISGYIWMWCISGNCQNSGAQLSVIWQNSGGGTIRQDDSPFMAASDFPQQVYNLLSAQFTAPTGATRARVVVYMLADGRGGGHWAVNVADDFFFGEAGPVATPTPPCANDLDSDNVCDEQEHPNNNVPAGGTNRILSDCDLDGLLDGQEDTNRNGTRESNETSARNKDTDGDNFVDGLERLMNQDPLTTNPGFVDSDGDKLPDSVDVNDSDKDSDDDRYDDLYDALFNGALPQGGADQKPRLGDSNADGFVTSLDALIIQSLFLEIINATNPVFDGQQFSDGFRYTDVNGDGFTTSLDALIVQSFFLQILPLLPLW